MSAPITKLPLRYENYPKRLGEPAVEYVKNRAMSALSTAAAGVLNFAKNKAIQTLQGPPAELLRLKAQLNGAGFTPSSMTLEARQKLADDLRNFATTVGGSEKDYIGSFCTALVSPSSCYDPDTAVEDIRGILNKHIQTGLLENYGIPASALDVLKPANDAPAPSPKDLDTQMLTLLYPNGRPQPAELPKGKAMVQAIKTQVGILKRNSVKVTLANIILYQCGISKIQDIGPDDLLDDLLTLLDLKEKDVRPETAALCRDIRKNQNIDLYALLIQVADDLGERQKTDSNEVYKNLVNTLIEKSEMIEPLKWIAQFLCTCLYSIISSYMNGMFETMEENIAAFAELPSEKQTEELIALMINPIIAYLSKVADGYKQIDQGTLKIDKAILGREPEVLLDSFLKKEHNEKFQAELLAHFFSAFLIQNIKSSTEHWSLTVQRFFKDLGLERSILVKGLCYTLSYLFVAIGFIVSPLEAGCQLAMRYFLLKIVKELAFPSLFHSTKSSLGVGKDHSWIGLKKNLLEMLCQFEEAHLANNPASQAAAATPVPRPVADRFKKLLGYLFKVLDLSMNSLNLPLKEKILEPCASMLAEMFVQEGFINGILLSSLQNLNAGCFTPQAEKITPEEIKAVGELLRDELIIVSGNILNDVKQQWNNSDQTAANVFVDGLKKEIAQFHQDIAGLQDLKKFETLRIQLIRKFNILRTQVQSNRTVLNAVMPYIDQFSKKMTKISQIATELPPSPSKTIDRIEALMSRPSFPAHELLKEIETMRTSAAIQNRNRVRGIMALAKSHLNNFAKTQNEQYKFHFEERIKELRELGVLKVSQTALHHLQTSPLDKVKDEIASLAAWGKTIERVVCKSEPSIAGKALELPITQSIASAEILKYTDGLFKFLDNEQHFNGLVWYMMDGYSRKPAR